MSAVRAATTSDGEIHWTRLTELVAERLGLHFPPDRRADLSRGLAGAAAEWGLPDAAACAERVLSAPLTRAQLHSLAAHLTVGETYFMRDRATLDALARRILPELIHARRGRNQTLRLWSAGCSTGEEAYSLAMLVFDLLPDLVDWRVTILATDINAESLSKGSRGEYGEWSFRDVPDEFRERYFTAGERGRRVVRAPIRDLVTFGSLNLVEDPYPSAASGTLALDVILCRNVLMYFTVAQMRRVIARLHGALSDDGWLAVSPSEASHALFESFATVNVPGAILYRKSLDASPGPIRACSGAPAPSPPGSTDARLVPESPALPPPPPPKPRHAPPSTLAAMARDAADRGRLEEARSWCVRWIAADELDPAAHYLYAAILLECGDPVGADGSLRRALHLEPRFVLAHFARGSLAARSGEHDRAETHFTDALALLRRLEPGDPLPEGDGLTAGRLMSAILTMPRRGDAR